MTTKYQKQAAAIVAEQVAQLRQVLAEAQARLGPALLDLRQVGRTIDELNMRTAKHDQSPILKRQIKQLHERQAALEAEVAELQRVTQSIEQLIRQTEMSSTALHGPGPTAVPLELALYAQIFYGREDERARLAREVHDGPAQVLAHILMCLEQGVTLVQQQTLDRLLDLLLMLRDTSRTGLLDIRRFIADLRPPTLANQGLDAALRELCERTATNSTLKIEYTGASLRRLAPEHEIVIYRVAQEALNNAAKHAPNAVVQVHAQSTEHQCTLAVHDNGPGFDPHVVAARGQGRHWGVAGMRERAALIGAQLTVATHIGQGTTVQLVLALDTPSTFHLVEDPLVGG